MKKLVGILAILTLLAIPLGLYAQVEASAGSIKVGAHIDASYRYSAEDDDEDVYWAGYDTFNAENVILGLSGKVGDKVSWKILEAFDIGTTPTATLLDANVEWKIIDQLGLIVGRQLVPTALSNVPHMMKVHHLANVPLMLTGGFNGGMVPLPRYQTGLGIDVNFSGVNLNYTIYNGELMGANLIGGDDLATQPDSDKMKGGNIALGYNGELGGGKLAARVYYFQEDSDITGPEGGAYPPYIPYIDLDDSSITGWGLGVLYNADKFFAGAEYMTTTTDPEDPHTDSNTQYGWYVLLGGRFSSIEAVLRYDFVDYSDLDAYKDYDTEQWWTIGVNYLINDNTTIGLDYTLKYPEEPDNVDYPNIDELAINVELDVL